MPSPFSRSEKQHETIGDHVIWYGVQGVSYPHRLPWRLFTRLSLQTAISLSWFHLPPSSLVLYHLSLITLPDTEAVGMGCCWSRFPSRRRPSETIEASLWRSCITRLRRIRLRMQGYQEFSEFEEGPVVFIPPPPSSSSASTSIDELHRHPDHPNQIASPKNLRSPRKKQQKSRKKRSSQSNQEPGTSAETDSDEVSGKALAKCLQLWFIPPTAP